MNKPIVVIKTARSWNGVMAGMNGSPLQISSFKTKVWMHRIRSKVDAIMVSTQTVRKDKPSLNNRESGDPYHVPLRVCFGQSIEFDEQNPFFRNEGRVLCFVAEYNHALEAVDWVEQIVYKSNSLLDRIEECLQVLAQKNIKILLIEAGPFLAQVFAQSQKWDFWVDVLSENLLEGEGLDFAKFSEYQRSIVSKNMPFLAELSTFDHISRDFIFGYSPIQRKDQKIGAKVCLEQSSLVWSNSIYKKELMCLQELFNMSVVSTKS